jgi:membrane protease YdiL (CAAX protease family)
VGVGTALVRDGVSALALVLALWLVAGQPVAGLLRRRRPVPLLRRYRETVVRQWGLCAVAALVVLIGVGAPPQALGLVPRWDREQRYLPSVLEGIAVGAVAVVALRWDGARRPGRSWLDRLLRPMAGLLPRSRPERWAFAAVAVTAGVTEEVLYRGFLMWWSVLAAPVGGYGGAMLLTSAAFGLGHAYQGVVPALLAGLAGLGLAVLAFSTGSLLLPVLLHVLVDLRVLLLLPRHSVTRVLAAP